MSEFKNKSITTKGLELLSKAMAGGKLKFTRIEMGRGTFSGDMSSVEALVEVKQNLQLTNIVRKGGQVTLSAILKIEDITSEYDWTEIGVYAKGADEAEVLYMYGYTTNSSFISKDSLNEKLINVTVIVSNVAEVTAVINSSVVYLTQEALEAHNTSNSAHSDIRELIKQLQGEIENIDVSWDGITDKPSTFPPSEHNHDDRYYTESEIDSKLNDKANTSHAHTKSQIIDFPTSLPANGGNADTVDGVHASSLAKQYIQNNSVDINNPNWKEFYGTCVSGSPSAPNTDWWHIINVPHGDNNGYGGQLAIGYHGNAGLQVRSAAGTSWGGWYDVIGNIENAKALASQSAIKSIQRGVISNPQSTEYGTVAIASVNVAKTIVLLNGSGAENTTNHNGGYLPSLVSLSSNSFTYSMYNDSMYVASRIPKLSWQVIEFN